MTDAAFDDSAEWDVIVIGSGIGGATVAHAVASKGLRVLILEKGRRVSAAIDQGEHELAEERMARGWWPLPVSQRKPDGSVVRFFAPVGCAVGGSSIHYAAALERMPKSDFEPLHEGQRNAQTWPVTYEEFEPFYAAAERLYRVQKDSNAEALARLSEWDRSMLEHLRRKGVSSEQLHVAINYDSACEECTGRICPRNCKADAFSACLSNVLKNPGCRLLENCDVKSLESDSASVSAVNAVLNGKPIRVRGRVVVLCAGAFQTPVLLLRSANHYWTSGLANKSDQVGRNLMFHTSDGFAVWAPRKLDRRGRQKKAVSIREFYVRNGRRLGYIQSLGVDIGRGGIAIYLKNALRQMGLSNELMLSLLVKIPSHLAEALLGSAMVFAGMTEDDADPDNRIVLAPEEPSGAYFTYTMTQDLRERARTLRAAFKASIAPWRALPLSPTISMNYGHPCGTCRAGNDPAFSVVDKNCKAHGIENLFVVDASFMPRSGAVNPSLTIAANALRVAPAIAACAGK